MPRKAHTAMYNWHKPCGRKVWNVLVVSVLLFSVLSAQENDKDSTSFSEAIHSILEKNKPSMGGLVQFWNVYQAKGGVRDHFDSFRFRRVEVKLTGSMNEHISYDVMVDFARSVTIPSYQPQPNVLQDAFLVYSFNPQIGLTFGQFKYSLTYEGLLPSAKLDFVERSEITRMFGDQRDVGLQLSGTLHAMSYAIGIFNGNSQNTTDGNREKDFAGRLTVKANDELSIGFSGYLGRTGFEGTVPYHRATFEAVYQSSLIKIFGEALWARESDFSPAFQKDMGGLYVAALYNVVRRVQAGARYEYANDHMANVKGIPVHRYTLGLNYSLDNNGNVKLQLNYILSQAKLYVFFQRFFGYDWNNYLYLNFQVSF